MVSTLKKIRLNINKQTYHDLIIFRRKELSQNIGLYFIGGSCGKVVSTMFNRSNRSDQVLIYDLIIGPVFGLHPKLQLYLQSNNLLKVHNSGNFVLYYFSVLVRSYGKLKIVKTVMVDTHKLNREMLFRIMI